MVDAENILVQLRETEVAREQITLADFVLLNKVDLVNPERLAMVETAITELNPHARIFRTEQSKVNLNELLDINAFDLDRKLAVAPELLNEYRASAHAEIQSSAYRFDQPFDLPRLEEALNAISERSRVFRSKGILWVEGTPRRAVFHGVNNRFTIYWDRLWEKQEMRSSQLVFIGKDLNVDGIRQDLARCLA